MENSWKDIDFKNLKVGDEVICSFNNGKEYTNEIGTIKYISKRRDAIGIEFENNIGGHDGGRLSDGYKGKNRHCWNFYSDDTYNLSISKINDDDNNKERTRWYNKGKLENYHVKLFEEFDDKLIKIHQNMFDRWYEKRPKQWTKEEDDRTSYYIKIFKEKLAEIRDSLGVKNLEVDPYGEENWSTLSDSSLKMEDVYALYIEDLEKRLRVLRSFKPIEESHNEIDPYGEEDWSDDEWIPLNPTTILPVGTKIKSISTDSVGTIKDRSRNPFNIDLVLGYTVTWNSFDEGYVYWNEILYKPKNEPLRESHKVDPYGEETWEDDNMLSPGDRVRLTNNILNYVRRGEWSKKFLNYIGRTAEIKGFIYDKGRLCYKIDPFDEDKNIYYLPSDTLEKIEEGVRWWDKGKLGRREEIENDEKEIKVGDLVVTKTKYYRRTEDTDIKTNVRVGSQNYTKDPQLVVDIKEYKGELMMRLKNPYPWYFCEDWKVFEKE